MYFEIGSCFFGPRFIGNLAFFDWFESEDLYRTVGFRDVEAFVESDVGS